MGFGHRVYKSYDPRAKIIKRTADEVFEVTGKNPLLDIALELERIALEDEYFVTPQALSRTWTSTRASSTRRWASRSTMFPVLFAIPRTSGWIAQWEEMLLDPEQKIARPRQIYIGPAAAGLRAAQQADVGATRSHVGANALRCRCELSVRTALVALHCCRCVLRSGDCAARDMRRPCTDDDSKVAPTRCSRTAATRSHRWAKLRSHLT